MEVDVLDGLSPVVTTNECAVEQGEGAEHFLVNELHDRKQFFGAVFDGLAGQGKAVVNAFANALEQTGTLACTVLDHCRLVNDHGLERPHRLLVVDQRLRVDDHVARTNAHPPQLVTL